MVKEVCMAHEFYGKMKRCTNTDIAVAILSPDKEYLICKRCWGKIAENDKAWKRMGQSKRRVK